MAERNDTERQAPQEVDAYINALNAEKRACLAKMRDLIRKFAPLAKERVSYGIPIFRLQQDLVGLSAAKNHCSLHIMSPKLMTALKEQLKEWRISGATIHFSASKPLPEALIKLIVSQRIAEINRSVGSSS
jgi:uncharacterized protein YdhG (YjbR/CyaY superfamily)